MSLQSNEPLVDHCHDGSGAADLLDDRSTLLDGGRILIPLGGEVTVRSELTVRILVHAARAEVGKLLRDGVGDTVVALVAAAERATAGLSGSVVGATLNTLAGGGSEGQRGHDNSVEELHCCCLEGFVGF